jgi:hypothetical protein
VVASDLLIQFGFLGSIIIAQTLQRPFWHVAFLAMILMFVTLAGWISGEVIRSQLPGAGLTKFSGECALWLIVVAVIASPVARERFRNRLTAAIPS